MERFCDIGNMICQWEEMEGEVLEGGMEDGGRAKKPVGGLVNIWGSLEREEEGTSWGRAVPSFASYYFR